MRLRKRPIPRPFVVRPLKPWVLAVGMLVSFTATAGIRTTVDPATPGLRFAEDPVNIGLAWPTLTAPDIAAAAEDFISPRTPILQDTIAIENEDQQLQPGLWRGAQPTDGREAASEATPEITVLFRLGGDIMPAAKTFAADDGGPIVGAFSGLSEAAPVVASTPIFASAPAQTKSADTITVAKIAPQSVPLPAQPALVKTALAPANNAAFVARPIAPRSPLVGTVTSEKELKCLAEAVYFESRSEPERGQAGVAQVVLNRSRSGVYPSTVCGVVYQNRHRYLACQFTFACEGKSLRITEPGAWSTAMRIAKDVAEGRTYLAGVGNATHYHANYVRPWWARHMDKREKVGKHIFYFESAEN
jgi:spore germination cell wall hydrolase CwlJ-like protein